jgi:serine/threonine protein kinase
LLAGAEYLPSGDMTRVLGACGQYSEATAAGIARQLLSGVAHLHEQVRGALLI